MERTDMTRDDGAGRPPLAELLRQAMTGGLPGPMLEALLDRMERAA